MRTIRKKIKAFTLVELLVVISIIALLLSILMPSLSKARQSAQNVVCRSNVKQLCLAAKLWSQDNGEWALPALWDRGNNGDTLLRAYLGGAQAGDKVMNCPAVKKYAGKTYAQLGLTADVVGFASGGNYYNSYGHNLKLCATTTTCPGSYDSSNNDGSSWGKGNVWYTTHGNCKLFTVRKPSKTIMFAEGILYISYPEFYTKAMLNPAFNDPSEKGRRHNVRKRNVGSNSTEMCGEMNIAWVDGSVSKEPDDMDKLSDNKRFYLINGGYWYGK